MGSVGRPFRADPIRARGRPRRADLQLPVTDTHTRPQRLPDRPAKNQLWLGNSEKLREYAGFADGTV